MDFLTGDTVVQTEPSFKCCTQNVLSSHVYEWSFVFSTKVQKEREHTIHSTHSSVRYIIEPIKSNPEIVKCVLIYMYIFKNLKIGLQRNIIFAKNWQCTFKYHPLESACSWFTSMNQEEKIDRNKKNEIQAENIFTQKK